MFSSTIADRLKGWATGKKFGPQMVQIYPTNSCNLKCVFCTQRTGVYEGQKEISKKRWIEILTDIGKMGVEEILISGGGEPLCVPDTTLEIIKKAKEYNLKGRIITNGTLWKKNYIKETIKLHWDTITFSIDAPDAETHDYLREVKGSFERTLKNIKDFQSLKIKNEAIYPILEITMVLNLHNYRKINEMIILAHELGIVSLNIEPICVNNSVAEKIRLGLKERKEFLKKIDYYQRLAKKYNIRTNLKNLSRLIYIEKSGKLLNFILKDARKNDFLNLPCYEPWLWPKIEANGDVWPCSSISLHENIENKFFREIWYGKEFHHFRKKIFEKNLPSECSNCVMTHLDITKEIKRQLS